MWQTTKRNLMQKKAMASTKTLYVDSRTRIRGTHSDFAVSLPEQMTLRDARVRIDNIRTTMNDRHLYNGELPQPIRLLSEWR